MSKRPHHLRNHACFSRLKTNDQVNACINDFYSNFNLELALLKQKNASTMANVCDATNRERDALVVELADTLENALNIRVTIISAEEAAKNITGGKGIGFTLWHNRSRSITTARMLQYGPTASMSHSVERFIGFMKNLHSSRKRLSTQHIFLYTEAICDDFSVAYIKGSF